MKMYSKKADNFVEEVEPKFDENHDSIDELDSDSDNDDISFLFIVSVQTFPVKYKYFACLLLHQ